MPIFRKQEEPDAAGFFNTGVKAEQVVANQLLQTNVNGQRVLLTRHTGVLYAFSNVCPHAAADLGKGRVNKGVVRCPDHQYSFDIRTGRPVWPPDEVCRLKRFMVQQQDGDVKVKLASQ